MSDWDQGGWIWFVLVPLMVLASFVLTVVWGMRADRCERQAERERWLAEMKEYEELWRDMEVSARRRRQTAPKVGGLAENYRKGSSQTDLYEAVAAAAEEFIFALNTDPGYPRQREVALIQALAACRKGQKRE